MKHLPENNTGKKNLCFAQDNEGRITEDDSSSAVQIDKSGLCPNSLAYGPCNVFAV